MLLIGRLRITFDLMRQNSSSNAARLYLVANRHVMIDEQSGHLPDYIEIEPHSNPENLAEPGNIWRAL